MYYYYQIIYFLYPYIIEIKTYKEQIILWFYTIFILFKVLFKMQLEYLKNILC